MTAISTVPASLTTKKMSIADRGAEGEILQPLLHRPIESGARQTHWPPPPRMANLRVSSRATPLAIEAPVVFADADLLGPLLDVERSQGEQPQAGDQQAAA